MNKDCTFCKTEHECPNTGLSNRYWYWQPNKAVSIGGTHVCRDKKRSACINWDKNNPEKAKLKYQANRKKRRSTPKGRLRHNFSSLMSNRLSGKSSKSTFAAVSYTLEKLTEHLESKFQPGMNWENYGAWEVDHIIPDCAFTYSSTQDANFKQCWALDNLRPLWSRDNKIKNGRF